MMRNGVLPSEDLNHTIWAECRADEGKKHVEKVEIPTHNVDIVKYVERKLIDKGFQRQKRYLADWLPLKHDPKKGHGGKYTWEGPEKEVELDAPPPAIDEKDLNYVEEEEDRAEGKDEQNLVVGKVKVAKVAEEGVARVEVEPHLKVN
ncbi:Hypothetical predicted protein [Olea europaea subsp. europaea]|uniref:Uncharacterized protein n=1 Tax=Olea europaea subsp. europaea TaxID=158383 RepID=A0A8S0QI84_OLEEU|nr:Hypothetical predicted protein [Olea europaea subsp. europaea]